MPTPLFSTYRQGENRVTSTLLGVLQRLSLPNIDRILQALLEDDSSLVIFKNQPKGKRAVPKGRRTVPDAKIETGSSIWIETKTARNAASLNQIMGHTGYLGDGEKLLVLTPDDARPKSLGDIDDPSLRDRIVWSNFHVLASAIDDILKNEEEPPSEHEAFLLREFVLMLQHDGLLRSTTPRVMVLAARDAWPMYEILGVYRCSVDKPMSASKNPDRIAFYVGGEIQVRVPRIKSVIESIDMSRSEEIESLASGQRELARELERKIDRHNQHHEFSTAFKVMFLSEHNDNETVRLEKPVLNNKKDKHGKAVPYTYGAPIYVTLESLQNSSWTSELVRS